MLLIRDSGPARAIRSTYFVGSQVYPSAISIVTIGEIRSLARQLDWDHDRVAVMERWLADVNWLDLNHQDVFERYVQYDVQSRHMGRMMGKNDLWIAESTAAVGGTLLTTDADIDHLIEHGLSMIRIHPNTGQPIP